jgi:hypothetical protein
MDEIKWEDGVEYEYKWINGYGSDWVRTGRIEHGGTLYREVVSSKAIAGDLIRLFGGNEVYRVERAKTTGEVYFNRDWYVFGSYRVLEPEETQEPSPQLAGIHDSLAKLALEVAKLRRGYELLTPLQLAILNAKDTPADVKLALIVEAGRLTTERQAVINDR